MVSVVEDREELAIAGEVVGQTRAGQRVGDRVGREARLALLAVGDDRLADALKALDRVGGRLVLLRLEVLERDVALVIGLVGLLELHRARQGTDQLGGDRHRLSPQVGDGIPERQTSLS